VKPFAGVLLVIVLSACAPSPAGAPPTGAAPGTDPLLSWNDGPVRTAVVDFVNAVTTTGSPDFVPPPQRIAVFDNDGTLWAEQPMYFQVLFVLDRIRALAPNHPEWTTMEPYRSALAGDMKALAASGEKGVAELLAVTHTGVTTDEFADTVRSWIATARHPDSKRPYTEMVYLPMLELLDYLRTNGFKTFIVSGGGAEFMRPWVENVYGIPPEQVIGSRGKLRYDSQDGTPALLKLPESEFIDDGPGKPVGIAQMIGRRPIAAFGNSDGDFEMLEYTSAGPGRHLALIVHHTDADREWSYDRASHIGRLARGLDEAAARGWIVADMKRDWKTIFPWH
jgi:phosphoglycolate phosphatase-like HAD superfamily hydrolase